jgi:hypothetical protein
MGLKHTAGMIFLASLLLGGVFASNLLVGVERTALDAEFAKETLDEEQVYSTALDQIESRITNQTGEDVPFDIGEILTREYIKVQVEDNIDSFYDYIHSRNDSLVLGIDISPLKDRLAGELEQVIRDQRLEDFDPQLARMTANESSYLTERASFRQDQYERIQQATAEDLSQQELKTAYDQRRETIRQQFLNGTGQDTSNTTAVQEATQEILAVKVGGLLNESLTYDAFMESFNSSLDRLASAQAEQVAAQMNENIPRTVDVTAELDQQQQERIEMARDGLSLFSLFVIILPLLTVGIAGLMWIVAGTQSGALLGIGHTVALGGLLSTGMVAGMQRLVVPELRQMLATDTPSGVSEIGVGILEQFLDAFMIQSAGILVLGLIILAAGIVLRRRESGGDRDGEEPEDEETGTASTDRSQAGPSDEADTSDDRQDNDRDPDAV